MQDYWEKLTIMKLIGESRENTVALSKYGVARSSFRRYVPDATLKIASLGLFKSEVIHENESQCC